MLQNRSQTVIAIKTLVKALGSLNDKAVFVGGSVCALYVDDPGAPEPRPTKDIDIVFEITSSIKAEEIRQALALRQIYFAKDENVICRFRYENIIIDILSTHQVSWAPSNPWFKSGVKKAEVHHLDEIKIRILPLAYYLASKFTAFYDRGKDPRTSPDFEDIVYVIDNRTKLVRDIKHSDSKVKNYLLKHFKRLREAPNLQEAILAHLEPGLQKQRYDLLMKKIESLI